MRIHKLLLLILFLLTISAVTATEKYPTIFDEDFTLYYNVSNRTRGFPVYKISVICPGKICMEGDRILFNVTMYNYGDKYFEIFSIWLVNAENGYNITGYDKSTIFVDPDDQLTILLNATLPELESAWNLTYYPCIRIALPKDHREYRSKYGLERTICPNEVFSTLIAECNTSLMCLMDEKCEAYDCKKLDCSDCQYIENHNCYSYECCKPEDCAYNETCFDHKCEQFSCKFYEHIENHECTVLYCDADELYINHRCIKLNCSYDEYVDNHRCRKLECKENEVIGNHSCVQLKCAFDEVAINHQCQKLNCKDNEAIVDHNCEPLECNFYEYSKNHKCHIDYIFIKNFSMEFVIWIMIILFIYLIEHIYRKRHPKGKEKGIV